MALQKRYYSTFKDIYNVSYRIEIWQENSAAYVSEEIKLASTPLTIEWQDTDKLDVIKSSSATLNLWNKSDRKFIDLYAVDVKSVRLDVYRNNAIYWSGTLDTELFEEPYSYEKSYVTTITFSDFAVLDRIKYNLSGFKTLQSVLEYCVSQTGINYNTINYNISTQRSSTNTDVIGSVSVLSDNFYNEDGEADTLHDVLEYALQPFTAIITQKNGIIYVTDINALSKSTPITIAWKGSDASLSVDKVYNEAEVTFSAYEQTEILNAEVDEKYYELPEVDGISVQLGNSDDDMLSRGFDIYLDANKGAESDLTITNSSAKYFAIKPTYSGQESRGVAWCVRPTTTQYLNPAFNCRTSNNVHSASELFKCKKQPYVGRVNSADSLNYNLCVKLDFMFDVRYNPFEQAAGVNEEGNWGRMQDWCNFAYVPIRIILRDAVGNALYHYENKHIVDSSTYKFYGKWVAGQGAWGDAYLSYYDTGNRKSSTGLGGWSTNKPCIGYYNRDLPSFITKKSDGEFIPMPPVAGWLDVRVGGGLYQFDYGREVKDIYSLTRWVLYKNVNIEVVDGNGLKINPKDQIVSAWLDKAAEERFEIETHFGTKKKASPIARGSLFNTSDKLIINQFYREGQTAEIERLMLGTLYSNYAGRKHKLSGTSKLIPIFTTLSEKNTTGCFMVTSESQDIQAARSEITMIEIVTDDYSGVELS